MKRPKKKYLYHIVNVVSIALVVECFLCAMMLVEKNAQNNCFDRIEEATAQASSVFSHAMSERQEKLTIFADILAANSENPDELLQIYMENFCKTQGYTAVCIHRANGATTSYGHHPHDEVKISSFEAEVARLPYVSEVFSYGKKPEDNCIYQAVPIVRGGKAIAVLYGYMSLESFPHCITSNTYDGKCQFYIVDGDTGDFLMDEYHGELGNIFDGSMGERETKHGYSIESMREGVKNGESGFYVFRSERTGDWYYTYYMPIGINNWSMQLTIDETTAFAAYTTISHTMLVLMILVIVLIVTLVLSLMIQNASVSRKDKTRLRKTDFINSVQHSLLNAYTNSDSVFEALKTVADEMEAETVMLLSFSDKVVSNAQCWPSKDKHHAADLIGRNIREDFPTLYDMLSVGDSVLYNAADPVQFVSDATVVFFTSVDIERLLLVPIRDTVGGLKGVIIAVNSPVEKSPEMMESVVYDFFMAITNLENHNIIKKMGTMDYLTGLKNRNCFEAETPGYVTLNAETLWCAFVDVNGLHELNNQKGHKAGDLMLCAVSDAIKRIFGAEHAYRLGGDEFVIFKKNSTHENFMSYKYRMLEELGRKGYSVSVGFAGTGKNRNGVFDVEKLLVDAEGIMYSDKWDYYEKNNIPMERGHFPAYQMQIPDV